MVHGTHGTLKWKEIAKNLHKHGNCSDKPELLCCVYYFEFKRLLEIIEAGVIERVAAHSWVTKFEREQRRFI